MPPTGSTKHVTSSPVRDLLALTSRPEVISFAGGLPAPELFDLTGLRMAFHQALSEPAGRDNLQYAPTEGNRALRSLVAARMTGKGLPTTGDDLLITTGSQQALTLVTSALLGPGAVVAVEEPTYLAALQCFRMAGARVVAVASDEHGMVPESLEEVIKAERPSLVYLVPTFANPTGRTLPAERRTAIAALAAAHDLWVVEDDPYGELRYRGEPIAPLAVGSDHVLHLGSFSKIGAPGLRLGWLRAPESLLRTLVIVKQAADLHTSTIDQAAAAIYLAAADLDAHIAGLRTAYRSRRDAMIAALPSTTPPGTTWTDPDGGMFVWVTLPEGANTTGALPTALAHDVAYVPGAPFYATTPDQATLRLSFTTNTPARITEGMARLAEALGGDRSVR
ncbi:PLP-dependent aminotransferase family protein [Umezawaea sp. Da 62-37]|uniref:aminotransferase-like domain-containing protein n=1 Tax=Umezawaea sp. Da 62-37 TaxID=3075927 RepID=UPI0028F6F322|nr:PLP-dependent aminotransferase family protein [Umezawaea sp. Da 62-37]WNV89482.1 PLP-dependent aminotransferase family protein [Umezawaea sp. Da 62-37]